MCVTVFIAAVWFLLSTVRRRKQQKKRRALFSEMKEINNGW